MTHFLYPKNQRSIDTEHRRIYLDVIPDFVKNAAGATWDFSKEWSKWGLDKTVSGGKWGLDKTVSGGKWAAEKGVGGTDMIYQQFKSVFDREIMGRHDAFVEREMQKAAQFFELASPDMVQLLRDAFAKESVSSLAELSLLLDHARWIDAFAEVDLFDDTRRPMQALEVNKGPLELLLSLPGAERKRMYAGYVDRFIPQDIQEKHVGVFGPDLRGPAHEDAVDASRPMLNDAMRDMLGMLDTPPADPESRALATETLENRYKFNGQTLTINGADVQDRANLNTDFENLTGKVPTLTDIRDLQGMATPSLLKGAAKLGIIGNQDVENYMELGRLRQRDLDAMRGESGRQIEDLTKVTKKELAREAMSMSDVFHNMSGFEKLGLVVAGFFALQSKGIRNVALGAAGYYYFAKFFLKSDKPFDPFSKGLRNINSIFFGLPGVKQARDALGLKGAMTSQEAIDRGQVVSEFLTDDAKEQIDASVTGFRLLHDMPMNELARYVELGDFSGVAHKGVLRTWDPAFQIKARRMLEENGLDKGAIDRFFNDTSRTPIAVSPKDLKKLGIPSLNWNAVETGDALATAFYLSASDDPRLAADVQFVEEARAAYGGSYDAILDTPFTDRGGRTANAKQIFFDIARAGKDGATSQTLGQFMAERMGLRAVPKSEAEALEESKFLKKKNELEGYTHMGQRAKLSAVDKGNVVEVGQRNGLYLQSPIVMPKAEFLAKTLVEIGSQWLTKVVPEKLIEMKAVIPAKYSDVFDAELAGEVVTWGADDLSLKMMPSRHAESSGYTFVQMSVADLYAKYDAWEKKPGRLADDKNPLA